MSRLADEAGFTLIECLVAAVIVAVGLLGTFAMLDGASGAQGASRGREAATGLAREVLETVRGDAYASISAGVLTSTLQGLNGYQSMSGSAAVISRRNINFAVTASVCKVDDPKDGLGTTDSSFCSASTPTSQPDNQPDDLRRVTVSVSWSGSRSTTITQAMMLSSTGAAVGLPMASFAMTSPANLVAPNATTITSSSAAISPCPSSPATACFTATSTGAQKVIFMVDGNDVCAGATAWPCTSGNSTVTSTCTALPCSTFSLKWNYSQLSDGVYVISARSVDANGVHGPTQSIQVTINNGLKTKPCGLHSTAAGATSFAGTSPAGCKPVEAGYNYLPPNGGTSPIFELRWQPNPERNVVGYVVQTGSGDAGTGTVVCRLDASGNVTWPPAQTPNQAPNLENYACIDESPTAPSTSPTSYGVYAVYSTPSATNPTADGPPTVVSQVAATTTTTTTSTTSTVDDLPVTKTFKFATSTPGSMTGCASSTNNRDMIDSASWTGPLTSVASLSGPTSLTFCTDTMTNLFPGKSRVQVEGGTGTMTAALSLNANGGKQCTFFWHLEQNSTAADLSNNGATGLVFDGGGNVSTHNTSVTDPAGPAADTTIAPTERLALVMALKDKNTGGVGSNCGNANIQYGGSNPPAGSGLPAPGSLSLTFLTQHQVTSTTSTTSTTPSWSSPGPPTSVAWVTTGSTTANVTWHAPAGGNVAFYRIYRDGQDYAHRYDTCEVGDTGTGGCDIGGGNFRYTDDNTGGTSHTYYVSAVYGAGTIAPIAATMGESTEVHALP